MDSFCLIKEWTEIVSHCFFFYLLTYTTYLYKGGGGFKPSYLLFNYESICINIITLSLNKKAKDYTYFRLKANLELHLLEFLSLTNNCNNATLDLLYRRHCNIAWIQLDLTLEQLR